MTAFIKSMKSHIIDVSFAWLIVILLAIIFFGGFVALAWILYGLTLLFRLVSPPNPF